MFTFLIFFATHVECIGFWLLIASWGGGDEVHAHGGEKEDLEIWVSVKFE